MTQIEAVVFDIGNVLIEWNPERHYDARIGETRRRAMFDELDLHGMNEGVDQGQPFKETVFEWAAQNPKWRAEIEMWHDDWLEMASPVIDRSVRVLRALRGKGVPVFALSNFGVETFAYAETQYPFLAEFDRRYISGHMKVTKPAQGIYQMLEDDCGVAPKTLLFADDRGENIDAAAARGWQTHLFTSPENWAACLVKHGMLTAEEAT